MNTEETAVENEAVETNPVEEQAQDITVIADPDAEKRSGVRELAQNSEAIAAETVKIVKEKPAAKPSFFIKKAARHVIKMDVLTSKEDGRVLSVSKTGLGIDFVKDFPFMVYTELVFEFSVPNYEDMSTYRQRSSVYRREAQQVIVDKLQLRNFMLVWHLKDWNLTDEDGKKVDLALDSNGSLSEESLAMVYAISPTLLDVVMTIFEKEILLG
jgi:hypothetical protein